MATQDRELVRGGVLQGYVLGSYSARSLGLKTTGNAGGIHNLLVSSADGGLDFARPCCSGSARGLLVTELMGQGVNGVTGDYSRGARGFWVENGVHRVPGPRDHDRRQPQATCTATSSRSAATSMRAAASAPARC